MFTLNPYCNNFIDSLDLLLKLLGGAGALILFIVGLKRYIKEQTWKKKEFVANEIKSFTSDGMAKNAMQILDWGERYIELFPDKENYSDRFVKVDREILKKALEVHENRLKEPGKERFTATEVVIRDTFDQYLSYFERYWQFIEAGLLTEKDIQPYLHYWVEAISTNIEDDVRDVLYRYINRYGFTGTQQLFSKFGKNIIPSPA